ncbi:MAG: hypothetical protein Q8J99_19070 [Sulfuritalea sp.]|nr:hypothetical protein [Sulfuritalea sp.]
MQLLLKSFFRYLAEVAASEAGELLSTRRKAHLLEAERYARHAAQAQPAAKAVAASPATLGHHRVACAARRLKARSAN